ncbi:hypothetical protein MBLNU457_5882t1 [Dothideomycetes sp. NU457]
MNFYPNAQAAPPYGTNVQQPPPPPVIHPQPAQQQYRPVATPVPSMVEVVEPRVKPEVSLHGYSFHKSKPYTKTGGWDITNRSKMTDDQEALRRLVAESSQDTLNSLRKEKQDLITSLLAKKSKSEKNPEAEWVIAYIKLAKKMESVSWKIDGEINHRIDVVFKRRPRSSKNAKKSSKNKDSTGSKAKSKKNKKGRRGQSDESDNASGSEDDQPSEERPPMVDTPPRPPVHNAPPPPPPINTGIPFRPPMPVLQNNPNIYVPPAQGVNAPHPNIHKPPRNPFQPRVPFQNNGFAQPPGPGQQGRGEPNMGQPQTWPPPIPRNPAPSQGPPPPAYAPAPPPYVPRTEAPRHHPAISRQRVQDWQDRDRGSSYYSDSDRDFWSGPASPASTATTPSRGSYYTNRNGERIWVEASGSSRRGKERRSRSRQRSLNRYRKESRERRDARHYSDTRHVNHRAEEPSYPPNVPFPSRRPFEEWRAPSPAAERGAGRDDAIFADEERRMRERDVEERVRGAYRRGIERGQDI